MGKMVRDGAGIFYKLEPDLELEPDKMDRLHNTTNYKNQCCGSGAGSARIRNFCRIRNRIRNSRVPDPGPYSKMDVNINKNNQKRDNFIILTIFIYRY
jgi:hypothetical protein